MAHSILLTGAEGRRSWSDDERREILAEAFAPGVETSAVARGYEVSSGLLYTWRRKARRQENSPCFLRAVVDSDRTLAEKAELSSEIAIVVELANGVRVNIGVKATEQLVAATLKALRS